MAVAASVPLGVEAYVRTKTGFPETKLRNLYLEKDATGASVDELLRLQRPGLNPQITVSGAVRGIFQMDGALDGLIFVVAGSTLYSTDLATSTTIGTVPDDGLPVAMGATFERLGLVSAGEFWTYDGTTLAQVDLPDGKAPTDLDVLNSYFILPLADGTFYWLAPGQADFSSPDAALQFATAEALPDGVRAVRRLRDEFFLFGSATVEVWQPTGDANATFQRAQGRTLDRGCQSRDSVRTLDNSVFWVGDDGVVYRVSDVPKRVSSFGIEERIRKRTDSCSAWTFTADGHKFYVLHIGGQGTFAYDISTETWSEFATIGQTLWQARIGCDAAAGPLAGNSSGKVFMLDPDCSTDDGAAFEKCVSGTVPLTATKVANPSLAIYVGSDIATSYSLRWKDALTDWSDPRLLSARAGSDILNAWRLPATRGAWRTFEISTTSAASVRISGARANETRAT